MMSSAKLRVRLNLTPLADHMKHLGVRTEEVMDSWVLEAGDIGIQIMREEAPEKTGALKASIIAYKTKPYTIKIGPTVAHAVYVELGTKPHEIAGKPILSWIDASTGKRIWASHVHHPGTRANPFVLATRDRICEILRDLAINKLKEAIQS